MTRPMRWGVLGAASFAASAMAPAIHEADDAELVALGTFSPEKAPLFQRFQPSLRVESYEGLLAAPDIDAVYIPLPNTLHVAWSARALEAGKHVLTEKPIAMQAGEIDRLIALRDRTGLLCAEAYMIVHHPQWIRAKALLAEGAVGRLMHVDASFSYLNADPANIRNRADVGGGGLRDIGVYTMGSVRFATGAEPETVAARVAREGGVDTTAHVWAQFPGFTFNGMTSTRMAPRQEVIFHGDRALLRLSAPFNAGSFGTAELSLERDDRTVERFRFPGVRQYRLQVENFGRAARGAAPYPWTLEDARGTQAMIDRVFEAAP